MPHVHHVPNQIQFNPILALPAPRAPREWHDVPHEERVYQMQNFYDRPLQYWRMEAVNHDLYWEVLELAHNTHPYIKREAGKYGFHVVIGKLIRNGHRPKNMMELIYQWPHASVNDPNRLAYTRSIEHGEQDRQTVTSLGRYLRRHFTLPDHEIRDIVAAQETPEVRITDDLELMVEIVTEGPTSCMSESFHNLNEHPYAVYDPSLGWGMAYMLDEDHDFIARALVFEGEVNGVARKCYVRTYCHEDSKGYTQRDAGFEYRLKELGYECVDGWPRGAKVAKIAESGGYLMPYVDGDNNYVEECGGYFELTYDSGTPAGGTSGVIVMAVACDDCNAQEHPDSMHRVGPDRDVEVCRYCFDEYYMYTVADCYMHYNDVVRTECGDYVPHDYTDHYDVVHVTYDNDSRHFYAEDCEDVINVGWVPIDEFDVACIEVLEREYSGHRYAHIDDVVPVRGGGYIHMHDTHGYTEVDGEWVADEDLTREDRDYLEGDE